MRTKQQTFILTLIFGLTIFLGVLAPSSAAPEERRPTKPWLRENVRPSQANPSVSTSKQIYLTGERVTFNFEFEPGPDAVLVINYRARSAPRPYAKHNVIGRTFARSFDQQGTYEAYIITKNDQNYVSERAAVFHIADQKRGRPDTRPSATAVHLNKTTYQANEPVTFNFAHPGANAQALLVIEYSKNNKWYDHDTIDVTGQNSYTTSFRIPGNYAAYLQLITKGRTDGVDSRKVTFKITPAPHRSPA
ncbi:MAG: hypothetical protein LBR56_01200 [Sporomusaceae bacterium]|nr:hypothetical protein [Sporomusaceae bacterium]